jgi:putative polyhydroxyalkanoate system protein
MADIDITRAHTLGLEGARAAARSMQAELQRKFGLTAAWKGDTLHFERPGLSGTFTVGAQSVHLSVTLGFMLKAMKASIESSVRHELDSVFSGTHRA